MRIDNSAYIVDLSRAESAKEGGTTSPAQSGRSAAEGELFDRIEISYMQLSLDQLKERLSSLPDVRPERVATARQALQDGYTVEPAAVAQKMLESFGA
jgi:flagellar biosynthesis anti-sigma factor FlgM